MTTFFSNQEVGLLESPYFEVMRVAENFYEIKSRNTGHCWIINKYPAYENRPIIIYHKHSTKIAYYHNHAVATTVTHAIKKIKGHDDYVLHPEKYNYARKEDQLSKNASICDARI